MGMLPGMGEYVKTVSKDMQGFDKMMRDIASDRKNRSFWKARGRKK